MGVGSPGGCAIQSFGLRSAKGCPHPLVSVFRLKLALVALFLCPPTLQCTYETLLAIVDMKGFTYLVLLGLAAGVSAGGQGRFFRMKRQTDDCQSGTFPQLPRIWFMDRVDMV
jgi:hypothetical protein